MTTCAVTRFAFLAVLVYKRVCVFGVHHNKTQLMDRPLQRVERKTPACFCIVLNQLISTARACMRHFGALLSKVGVITSRGL